MIIHDSLCISLFIKTTYLFFGCAGSSLLHTGCLLWQVGRFSLVVRGLLIAVAPPVVEHGLGGVLASVTAACGCSGHGIEQWDPPGLGF